MAAQKDLTLKTGTSDLSFNIVNNETFSFPSFDCLRICGMFFSRQSETRYPEVSHGADFQARNV
jgi:hypothetical protein